MSISQNFPATWPSLTLDFANSKTLDPRVTFTRASTGTYVGNDGLIKTATADQARFDHDPATGESLGLLIEESRINYAINSENLDTWDTGRCIVTANQIISPDGQLTAEELKFNNTSSNPLIYRAKPGSGVYAISCFFKKGSVNGAYIYIDNPSLTAAIFDLENGITKAYDNTKFSYTSIEDYGNGWYRCSAITISISGSNYGFGPCTPESATTGVTCPTDGSVYAWGTQIEAGSFPTSYIPTSGSQVTRSQDYMALTGTNFSSWQNPSQGTYVMTIKNNSTNTLGLPSPLRTNSLFLFFGTLYFTKNTTSNVQLGTNGMTTTYRNWAFYHDGPNGYGMCMDGQTPLNASNPIGTSDSYLIANDVQGETSFYLKKLRYYPTLISNAELRTLTK